MSKLNLVHVFFKDSKNSYATNLSVKSTVKSAQDYFVGTFFDVADYPLETLDRCVGICFTDENNNTDHFIGECSKANLEKFDLRLVYEMVTGAIAA